MSHKSKVLLLFLWPVLAGGQSTTRPQYLEHALIEHGASTTTVTANYPAPLFQAIEGIRREYGWVVNWEGAPCYSRFDVVDDTSPKWRAAHPNAEGVTREAGGVFSDTFTEPQPGNGAAEETVLRKVIKDYDATENPGKYALRVGPRQQYTVVGTAVRDDTGALKTVTPVLDTVISVAREKRSAHDALDAIAEALSSAVGKRVIVMGIPNNLFRDTEVSVGGTDISARQLLEELLEATHRPLQYDLGFNPDHSSAYILNVLMATKTSLDNSGGRSLVPIDRAK